MPARWRVKPTAGGSVTPPVTDISLSASSVADDATSGTVVGALTNNLGISVSWSITDNTKFQLSASTGTTVNLERSGTGTLTAGVGETVTIRATRSGTAPYDEPFSVSVTGAGADTPLGVITVTETSGGTKTNEIVSVGFPLHPDWLATQPYLRVWTATGSVGSDAPNTLVAAYQVDFDSTDPATSARWARLTFIIPSLAGDATVRFVVCASNTSQPTGTAITTSDVTAATTNSDIAYDIAGTTYSVDTDTIFGSSETFSKTSARCIVASSGAFRTTLYGDGPPKNGGSAHASGNGLRAAVVGEFFKVGTAVVSGGNPITLAYMDIWTDNGDTERVSPSHYYYGLNIRRPTSLSDATLINTDDTDPDGNIIRYYYPRSTPAATLTATGATGTGFPMVWTRSTGAWDTDILGADIRLASGAGGAKVIARNSNTSIDVWVYEAFGATSYTSGQWTIEGIGHHYGCPVTRRRIWIGNKPTNIAAWGSLSSAETATTNAPLALFAETLLGLNYQITTGSITLNMDQLNAMRASDGTRRPMTSLAPVSAVIPMGDVKTSIGGPGDADGIGPVPRSHSNGLGQYTADGRRKIFENAEYWSTVQYNIPLRYSGTPAAGELGTPPRADNGNEYKWNPAIFGGTLMNVASTSYWPFDGDNAHQGNYFYIPWLLTGDLYWLLMQQRAVEYYATVVMNYAYNGTGINKTPFGDALANPAIPTYFGSNTTRMKAWGGRDVFYTAIMTPDSISAKIANAKSYGITRAEKCMAAAKAYGPDDASGVHSGAEEGWQNPSITSFPYGAADAVLGGSNYSESGFMISYLNYAIGIGRELNMLGTDGDAFQQWLSYDIRDRGASSGLVPDITTYMYWWFMYDGVTFTTLPSDAVGVYKNNCLIGAINTSGPPNAAFRRTPSGAITLSNASVGTGRTMTFASGYFDIGDTWYVGGYVMDWVQGGIFVITGVNSAGTVLTGNVLTAFGGTSLTAANIRIPGPNPGDYTGDCSSLSDGTLRVYAQYFEGSACLQQDAGNSAATMAGIVTYIRARPSYANADSNFYIAAR